MTSSRRMLKKAPSFVPASLKASTYRKGTPWRLPRCGLLDAFLNILSHSCFTSKVKMT